MAQTKQAIVIRRDLKLRRSQIAALAARTSAEVFTSNAYQEDGLFKAELAPFEIDWVVEGTPRVVLGVASEGALKTLLDKADFEGLITYPVSDESGTQIMAVAIGPDEVEKIDKVTGNLKLL